MTDINAARAMVEGDIFLPETPPAPKTWHDYMRDARHCRFMARYAMPRTTRPNWAFCARLNLLQARRLRLAARA